MVDGQGADAAVPVAVDIRLPRLRTAAIVLLIVAGGVAGASQLSGRPLDIGILTMIGASLVTTLTFAVAWLNLLAWRLTGEPRTVYLAAAAMCLATFPLTLGVLAPAFVDSPALSSLRPAFSVAGAAGLVVLAMASRHSEQLTVHRARRLMVRMMAIAAGLAAAGAALPWLRSMASDAGVPMPLAGPYSSPALVAAFIAIAVLHGIANRQRTGHFLSWTGLAAAGVAVAYAVGATNGSFAQPGAWMVAAVAVGVGLYGAAVELQRDHAADRRLTLETVRRAAAASDRAQTLHDAQAEHRHEARSALLGIEAAARTLAQHRSALSVEEFALLSDGLVAEVHRLRSLVEDRLSDRSVFDLREAITPVVTCARAEGLDVRSSVPPGIAIEGTADSAAQVMRSLLANARHHAPGSPVDVTAVLGDTGVTLVVEDRGPGVPEPLRAQVFERGARGSTSEGSGLGLFIVRQLVTEQHGSIDVHSRPGGGSMFVVKLQRAAQFDTRMVARA